MGESLISKIAKGELVAIQQDGDYVKDGLLYCGKCDTPKEYRLSKPFMGIEKGAILCECEEKADEERRKRQENLALAEFRDRQRTLGLGKRMFQDYTFANDDKKNKKISELAINYANNWEKVEEKKIGLLFYGDIGTGKTFYAVAIANQLIDQNKSVKVTTIAEATARMQTFNAEERQVFLDEIIRSDLLVIDDIGAERDTSFGLEQAFMIIDARYNSNKPMIATTNCSIEELTNPENIAYKRIYDRVLEMCNLKIKVDGKTRRESLASEKTNDLLDILGIK